MFKRIFEILSALCLAGNAAAAQSPFIGTWKLDPLKTRMPDEMKVISRGGNTYTFDFGGGAETIVVDGSDQAGLDDTRLSVKAAAPDTWIVERKKGGKPWINASWTLSSDGVTLRDNYRQFEPDGSTMSMDYVYRRVGAGSGFAADWQSIKETMNSPFEMQVSAYQSDGLSFVSPFGTTNATFVGESDSSAGASAGEALAKTIRRVDDRTLLVTIRQNGKVAATEDVVLSPDLKTLTMTMHIAGRDRPNVLVFDRKP